MYQFFVKEQQISEQKVYIEGNDYNHLKNVVRMKVGETFRVSTLDSNKNYMCSLKGFENERAVGEILSEDESGTELKGSIVLFQGLPKGDKMELIIQKAVELGVHEIVPVRMKNCVVKLDEKKAKAKVARWNAISLAAAKQSKRSLVPTVHEVVSLKEAMELGKSNEINLVPYENEEGIQGSKNVLSQIEPQHAVGIFIGPEGGFDEEEITLLRTKMQTISLGKRILRTETAAITAMALVMMQMEE
ncbi:MAG: 16S rRNA (uracil(1498)-N(3))-methyltransferase [Lachnospiraceae bacterium]|nr:16S rRNA (uracil(1498)-N(3))-methyltransferase [Lachnospiraceae bacterium]